MLFLQAVMAPVIVMVGHTKLSISKVTVGEMKQWAAQISAQRAETATKSMSPEQRAQFLMYNPVVPLNLGEMKAMIRTAEGAEQVVRSALASATVQDSKGNQLPLLTPGEIDSIINASGTGRVVLLGWTLADVDEQLGYNPPKGEGEENPLPPSGTGDSKA